MATRTPLRTTTLALACTLAGLFTTAHAAETPKTIAGGELKVGMEITYPPCAGLRKITPEKRDKGGI